MEIRIDDNFYLSQVRSSDVSELVTYMQERAIHDSVANLPDPYTEKEARFWISYVERVRQESGRLNNWAIRDRRGILIGGIGFRDPMPPGQKQGDFGYWIGKPYWGQGIMTRVVSGFCDFALSDYGLRKIEARVFPENEASARVLLKAGFEKVKTLSNHIEVKGRWCDVDLYARRRETPLRALRESVVMYCNSLLQAVGAPVGRSLNSNKA